MSTVSLVVGMTLVVLSNIPVLWPFFRHGHPSTRQTPGYYRDEDGEATTSSLQAFGGKWIWRSIAGFSLVGLTCASAAAIIVTCGRSSEVPWLLWCQFAGWVSCSIINIMSHVLTQIDAFFLCISRRLHREIGY